MRLEVGKTRGDAPNHPVPFHSSEELSLAMKNAPTKISAGPGDDSSLGPGSGLPNVGQNRLTRITEISDTP
jgi:hypothetical protein